MAKRLSHLCREPAKRQSRFGKRQSRLPKRQSHLTQTAVPFRRFPAEAGSSVSCGQAELHQTGWFAVGSSIFSPCGSAPDHPCNESSGPVHGKGLPPLHGRFAARSCHIGRQISHNLPPKRLRSGLRKGGNENRRARRKDLHPSHRHHNAPLHDFKHVHFTIYPTVLSTGKSRKRGLAT